METKYTFTFDKTTLERKPTRKEIGIICNRLKNKQQVSCEELASYLQPPYRYTVAPATFKGVPSSENWESQTGFLLDFDNKKPISKEEVMKRFKVFEITPNIVYDTFNSSEEEPRFRIVLLIETPIIRFDLAQKIYKGLGKIFPEADPICQSPARIFLPGNNAEVVNRESIKTLSIVHMIETLTITRDGGRLRKTGKFLGHLDILVDVPEKNQKTFDSEMTESVEYLKRIQSSDFDYDTCRNKIKIFDDFLNGVWLHYPQFFGLATNLNWLPGGTKLMKETMERYNLKGVTLYEDNNFNTLKYIGKYEYYPMLLENFSPYEEDHVYRNLLTAAGKVKGYVETVKPCKKYTLANAEKKFARELASALENNDHNVYLFKVAPGIGKSERIKDLDNVVIALPTHKLIGELGNRREKEYVTTPQVPDFNDEKIRQEIQKNYQCGLHDQNFGLIKQIATGKHRWGKSNGDRVLAGEYLDSYNEARGATKTVLTTHDQIFLRKFEHDTIIFDEDPLSKLIQLDKIKISDLIKIEPSSRECPEIKDTIDCLRKAVPGAIYPNNLTRPDLDKLYDIVSDNPTETNIFRLFNSTYYIRDKKNPEIIHFVRKGEVPSDKKIIILSATASVPFYKKFFGKRLRVFDISLVENLGRVTQKTRKSYSRGSMDNLTQEDLESLKEKFMGNPVITFQKYAEFFNEKGFSIYFHNCEGYDELRGKDLVVLGTPHLNPMVYLLYAKAIGTDLENKDLNMRVKKVEWNGFRFDFMSFNDLEMRELQLSLIEAELIQAIGRARAIREKSNVVVYSNLPLRIADRIEIA